MGKVKTVVMGDEVAEAAAREKAKAKNVAKKAEKKAKEQPQPEPVEATLDTPQAKKPVVKKATHTGRYNFAPGKKYTQASSLVDKNHLYSLSEAVTLVQKTSYSRFDGSVELHVNVLDKGIRGIVSLPHGTGKTVRVKIADDELLTNLAAGGKIDFDILVASPEMMPKLAKVAKILGPKGLMPSPKTGTIGPDPKKLASELSQGQLQWKTEAQTPIIHLTLGKVSFDSKQLEENLEATLKSIGKDKIRSAFIKATMGPSIRLVI